MQNLKIKIYRLLRWSERYTKTNMVYLVSSGFWLTLGQIISSMSSTLLAIAFANLIPREVYGTYQYALSIMGLLTIFTLTGMNTAVTQAVARGFNKTLETSFWVQMKWNSIMFFASTSMAIYYFINGNKTLTIALLIIGVLSPLANSSSIYSAFLNGKKDFKNLTKYGIATNILSSFIILIAVLLTQDPLWIISANIVTTTAINLFFYINTIKKIHQLYPDSKTDLEIIGYGRHLSLINIISTIASQTDAILLFYFLGPTKLAIYAFATAPIEQIKGIIKSIIPLSIPKFATQKMGEVQKTIWAKIQILFLTLACITVAYILAAPYIFKFLFPKYIEATQLSQIYSLVLPIFFFVPIYSVLQAHKKVEELRTINNITSISQILFLYIGIYYYGLIGAIIAQILYRVVFSISSVLVLKNLH